MSYTNKAIKLTLKHKIQTQKLNGNSWKTDHQPTAVTPGENCHPNGLRFHYADTGTPAHALCAWRPTPRDRFIIVSANYNTGWARRWPLSEPARPVWHRACIIHWRASARNISIEPGWVGPGRLPSPRLVGMPRAEVASARPSPLPRPPHSQRHASPTGQDRSKGPSAQCSELGPACIARLTETHQVPEYMRAKCLPNCPWCRRSGSQRRVPTALV